MPRPKGPPPTTPVLTSDFLNDACDRPKTEATYHTALVNLQRFAEGSKLTKTNISLPPHSIQKPFLADYYTWMRRTKRFANASIRLYLTVAIQYLAWLEAGEHLAGNLRVAAMRAELEKKTGSRGRRVRPERRSADDAIGALLAYYQSELGNLSAQTKRSPKYRQQRLILLRNHALLHTLYTTAGRAAEIASLQRADVAEGWATQVEVTGKGGRRRMLVLTTHAQSSLQAYLRERKDSSPSLFVSHGAYRERQLTTASIWQIVNRAAKHVFGADSKGRPLKRVGPHAFRHLRAQHLSDEGMPITSLQAMLGHASISTTRDIYAPKTPSEKLVEEIATYGRDPKDVIGRGQRLTAPDASDS